MSDKTYVFDSGAGSLSAMLPSLLQSKGIDPAYLMGIMNNGGGNGFWGGNGFQDILALIVVAAIFGNGNFGFGNNNNSTEREMLMSAIQRNGTDLSQLASSLNCSVGQLDNAIGQVATQICNLTGQVGLSSQQIINSILSGNASLAHQLSDCCCRTQTSIQESNYLTERGFNSTNQILTKGFADIGYATQSQTCSLEKSIASSTAQILEGQRAAEMRDLQDKLDALREKNAQQAVILNNAQQTAQFSAMLAPIAEDLASIKCKLPKTEVVNVQPEYVPVNRGINVAYTPTYCGYGLGSWSGNGCYGANSLWG